MIVTPSRAAPVSTSPSTSTGSQRARRAPSAAVTRSMVGPARWMNAIVPPRSSTPSKLTMLVSPSRLARSRTSARAPSRPYSSASGKSTPTRTSGGNASRVARTATTPARARRAIGHTVRHEQEDAGDAGGANEQVRHAGVERTEQRAHRQGEELERAEHRQRGGRESRRHGEGLAFRVVMRDEPHRDASPRADPDHVDGLERHPPEAV